MNKSLRHKWTIREKELLRDLFEQYRGLPPVDITQRTAKEMNVKVSQISRYFKTMRHKASQIGDTFVLSANEDKINSDGFDFDSDEDEGMEVTHTRKVKSRR
jgi:hypothetical protein